MGNLGFYCTLKLSAIKQNVICDVDSKTQSGKLTGCNLMVKTQFSQQQPYLQFELFQRGKREKLVLAYPMKFS